MFIILAPLEQPNVITTHRPSFVALKKLANAEVRKPLRIPGCKAVLGR